MDQQIQTRSVSSSAMIASDILLRETTTTRLIFRPLIVQNINRPDANVRWSFIFQKKGKNDLWEDSKDIPLSSLKKGEWVSIELHADEVLKLLENIDNLKQLYAQFWIQRWISNFHITDENINEILQKLSTFKDKWVILEAFAKLDISQLENIESLVSINRFQRAKNDMENNMENGDEKWFWQPLFKKEAWILSQIFSAPFVFVDDEFFVWWKRWNNQGGVFTDYLFQNSITRNIAFIEVKTPLSELVWKTKYRWKNDTDHNTVYPISNELSGAINQLLNQKKTFLQKQDSIEETDKFTYNTRCILICWNTEVLSEWQLKSFELYRSSLKDVEIITFNELLKKIANLLSLFSEDSSVPEVEEEISIEDIPF